MADCGCDTAEGFIKFTHAASMNDTFWIKTETEPVTWDQVSLFRNEFNETVSKLAFEGGGLYGIGFSTTSPELTTDGTFRKCWKREEDGIYLYKGAAMELQIREWSHIPRCWPLNWRPVYVQRAYHTS